MTRVHFLALASLTITAAALAGCTPVTPATPTAAAPRSTPSATPTVDPVATSPTPRFDLDCAALTPPAPALSAPVSGVDPIATYAGAAGTLPRISFVPALGGLSCEWSNGVPQASITGGPATYVGILLSILPGATGQWARFAETYSLVDDREFSCGDTSCGLDQLVGEYWISAEANGVADPAAVETYLQSVVESVAALPAAAPAWEPPAGVVALGPTCEEIIPAAIVQAALGSGDALVATTQGGGWSQWAGARVDLDAATCSWSLADRDDGPAALDVLPAGAWAAEAYVGVATYPTAPTTATVAGLRSDDSAYLRCDSAACYLDLIVGGNWIQVTAFEGAYTPAGAAASATAIGAAIVERLYP